jgi:hypothetical protein
VRALASQSGRAPGVYPGHRMYLLTGLLTDSSGRRRRSGTPKMVIERSRRSPRRAETSDTPKTHVVWLITQRLPSVPDRPAKPGN